MEEKGELFIELTAEVVNKITTKQNEKLRFFLRTDKPEEGKSAYSSFVEKAISDKYKAKVSVTQGTKQVGLRATIYMQCRNHKKNLVCWVSKEDFKENSALKLILEPKCTQCFPNSSFAGKLITYQFFKCF